MGYSSNGMTSIKNNRNLRRGKTKQQFKDRKSYFLKTGKSDNSRTVQTAESIKRMKLATKKRIQKDIVQLTLSFGLSILCLTFLYVILS